MNTYRLDPVDPGHSSWINSNEKDTVWAAAATPTEARDLVAAKTECDSGGADSPWRNDAATSCIFEPSMWQVSAGTVVREDGSRVGG